MKIKSLEMKWFRGASASATLNTELKNVVIYGANGSGKSSFVDAIEYTIKNGRISHLAHEYSGRKQEHGVINTKKPNGTQSEIHLEFSDNNKIWGIIEDDGDYSFNSSPNCFIDKIQNWKSENYILRQDEVANFIYLTKSDKFSVLLPLLGLEELDGAVDTLKRVHKRLKKDTQFEIVENHLNRLKGEITQTFNEINDPQIMIKVSELCATYDLESKEDIKFDTHELLKHIDEQINDAQPEHTRYLLFTQCKNEMLKEKYEKYTNSKAVFSEIATDIIDTKIEILKATRSYIDKLQDEELIECPACGQSVSINEFHAHVESEINKLEEASKKKTQYEKDERAFSRSLINIVTYLSDKDIQIWMNEHEYTDFAQNIIDTKINLDTSKKIDYDTLVSEVHNFLEGQLSDSLPELDKLLSDSELLKRIRVIPGLISLNNYYSKVKSTLHYIEKCETLTLDKIKEMAESKIKEITEKIRELWVKIHPEEPIEDIKLYLTPDADRALDISLKFYGEEQPSPRLTLSEGHRNSLGLCIFLALALSNETDDPLILDDVVSSLDIDHRTRLTQIIRNELKSRQVILFTHDRSYYSELRYMLSAREWVFHVLSPWSDPLTGIHWSRSTYSFEDARAIISVSAESAANKARAILDTNMSMVAEKLQIPVIHLRGVRNDKRTCIEYLERIIPIAESNYKIKVNDTYSLYTKAATKLRDTKNKILAYGNPPSHGAETGPITVNDLIDTCEEAVDVFRCSECKDFVWIADISSRKRSQCHCGKLRWDYG